MHRKYLFSGVAEPRIRKALRSIFAIFSIVITFAASLLVADYAKKLMFLDVTSLTSVVRWVVGICAGIVALVLYRQIIFRYLGVEDRFLEVSKLRFTWLVGVPVVICVVAAILRGVPVIYTPDRVDLGGISVIFLAAASEEIFFRWFVFQICISLVGFRFGLFAQAMIFALAHNPDGLYRIGSFFIFATAAGLLVVRYKSLIPAMIFHFVVNILIGTIGDFSVGSGIIDPGCVGVLLAIERGDEWVFKAVLSIADAAVMILILRQNPFDPSASLQTNRSGAGFERLVSLYDWPRKLFGRNDH